ncbi:hypothetical protein [Chromobacterium phragmitis]|uniref:hypothetical protein n=1 Tax=Chromobacterium phragmitis TaxID=2202141 RepID=UPI003877C939
MFRFYAFYWSEALLINSAMHFCSTWFFMPAQELTGVFALMAAKRSARGACCLSSHGQWHGRPAHSGRGGEPGDERRHPLQGEGVA